MAGVSVGFAKCFILFMAVVILAQGLIYLGLSIWGITLKDCQTTSDISGNPFKFAMDLIYFIDKKCGPPELAFDNLNYQLTVDWDKSLEVTNREYIFMITYAVISGLWVASSFLIIFTLCFTTTKLISGTVYWPWFLSVLAGCILDVVASVYHGLDITKTTSLRDAFDFVGVTVPDIPVQVMTQLETFGVYFSTPALVLLLLSCRVVLIWLLNLIGGMFCLSLANVLANQAAASSAASNNHIQPRAQTPQPVMMVYQEQEQLPTAPAASASASVVAEPQYAETVRSKPAPIMIPPQNGGEMMRQESMYPPNDRTTLQSPVLVLPPIQQQQQQQQQQFSPQPQPDINTYRTTDAHPDQLNYPPNDPTSPRVTSPAVQQLASGSALNSRYSEIYPAQPTNPRVSEELRNQMPWSYTSMITKPPPPPRKPQQQVQIYPQIPEPDYTEM